MNLWNLKYSKQRLGIVQRTQAQKRHLLGLIKAKSVVSSMNESFTKQSNLSYSKMSRNNVQSPRNLEIVRNNNILVKKLGNIQKLKDQKYIRNSHCKFINITKSITNNHHHIFHISKNIKQKKIDEQNTKMFTRLVQTSPTIKRNDWIKNNVQRMKYKQNMNKSRYVNPDYSIEASKLLKNNSLPKKYHLRSVKTNVYSSTAQICDQNNKPLTREQHRIRCV